MGSWRFPLLVTSGITAAAGLLVFVGVSEGPYPFPPAKQVKLSQTLDVLRTPSVLLPILGYTGHREHILLTACRHTRRISLGLLGGLEL